MQKGVRERDTTRASRGEPPGLPAKLTRPHASTLLPRQRLFTCLDAPEAARWSWISGPAGTGKTSLASSWIEARGYTCLWYRLDPGDADPATFFHYLTIAGSQHAGSRRVRLPPLQPEFLPGLELYTRRFCEQLFRLYAEPFVMVLDNYHELPADAPLTTRVLGGLLENLPAHGRLLCVSRHEMPRALVRSSCEPQFRHLRWEDLSLTDEEAIEFAQRSEPTALGVAVECNHWVRGWITGLKLLLRAAPDELRRLSSRDHEATQGVFDYFAYEVLGRMPATTLDFLLRASLLPDMEAPTVTALTEREDAGAVLSNLYEQRLFIERRLLPAGPSYQFHPLFRGYLLKQLAQSLGPGEFTALKLRAARALEERGQIEAAILLALETDDAELLVRLVRLQATELLAEGRLATLEQWLCALPPQARDSDGWLLYWLGVTRSARDPGAACESLEKAYHRLCAANDIPGTWLTCAQLIQTLFANWGDDTRRMWRWVEIFEELRAAQGGSIPAAVEHQVIMCLVVLVGHCPEHPLARHVAARATVLAPRISDFDLRCGIAAVALGFLVWQGDESAAWSLIDSVGTAPTEDGRVSAAGLIFDVWEGTLSWVASDHQRAFARLTAGRERCRGSGLVIFEWLFASHLGLAALSAGRFREGGQLVDEALGTLHPLQTRDRHLVMAMKAVQLALAGHTEAGVALARELGGAEQMGDAPSSAAFARSCLSAALLEGRALEEAEACGLQVVDLASRMPSDRWLFEGHMLLAGINLERGAEPRAVEHLRSALALARTRNFRGGLSLWQPIRTARLLALALRHEIEPAYVERLIRHRRIPPPAKLDASSVWPTRLRIDTLGRFGVWIDGVPLRDGEKVRKPLEVLKALAGLGSADISLSRLAATLWPELEGPAAHNACHVAIHRLRKSFGDESIVLIEHGTVALNVADARVDVDVFRRTVARVRDCLAAATRPRQKLESLAQELLGAYPGHFLPGEEQPWTVGVREQLRAHFVHLTLELCAALERAGAPEEALALCRRGIELDPLAEAFHRGLMRGLVTLGRRAEALEAFHRCRETLQAGLGVTPSAETRELHSRVCDVPDSSTR